MFRFKAHAAGETSDIASGDYVLGSIAKVDGNISDIVIEGLTKQKTSLSVKEGKLVLTVKSYVEKNLVWSGDKGTTLDLDNTANLTDAESGEAEVFTTGSDILFPATASNYNVVVSNAHGAVYAKSITFDKVISLTISLAIASWENQ